MHSQKSKSDFDFDGSVKSMEDRQEYKPREVFVTLRDKYPSFKEFEEDLQRYSTATLQTFIKRRSEKLKPTHVQEKDLVDEPTNHSQ